VRRPADFAAAFTTLLRAANTNPRRVERATRRAISHSTVDDWKNGRHLPADRATLQMVVEWCLTQVGPDTDLGEAPDDVAGWLELLAEAEQTRDGHGERGGTLASTRSPTRSISPAKAEGRRIEEWGPIGLGVHRAIGSGPLPPYVHRAHDHLLYAVFDPKVAANRLVVLRGGSSTGKSRAAYEAVRMRMRHASVLYPADAAALDRLLERGVPARSVLWLNELRTYAEETGGQQILAKLADLLTGRDRVVVITSLWDDYWAAYTADPPVNPGRPDPVAATRALLTALPVLTGRSSTAIDGTAGGVIDVPDAFTGEDLDRARRRDDPLLHEAIAAAERAGTPGQVAQYLAGVYALLDHYEGPGADPYAHALITAAMDAVRLGHTHPLSLQFVQDAAIGYLDSKQRALPQSGWHQAMAKAWEYAARQLKGAVHAGGSPRSVDTGC
jgi:hypothetical protein